MFRKMINNIEKKDINTPTLEKIDEKSEAKTVLSHGEKLQELLQSNPHIKQWFLVETMQKTEIMQKTTSSSERGDAELSESDMEGASEINSYPGINMSLNSLAKPAAQFVKWFIQGISLLSASGCMAYIVMNLTDAFYFNTINQGHYLFKDTLDNLNNHNLFVRIYIMADHTFAHISGVVYDYLAKLRQ